MIKTSFVLNGEKHNFSNLEPIDVTDFMEMIKTVNIQMGGQIYHYKNSYLDLDKKEFVIEIG